MADAALLPPFTADGLLPPGDYALTLDELLASVLVTGPGAGYPLWDSEWRRELVVNLGIMVGQLWQAGIDDIFLDGSFAEDKDHPNDIDGYFVCDLTRLASGELERELNRLDPHQAWTWDPTSRRPFRGYPKRQLPMWHTYHVELYPHYGQLCGIRDKYGHELEFPAAFRRSRRDGQPWGDHPDCEEAMIRSETEYQEVVNRAGEEAARLKAQHARLKDLGLSKEEIKRALDPMRSFHQQLQEEIDAYERFQRGEFAELRNLEGLGRLFVALRIAKGISQRELAERIGVHESQVSRDERNEYRGITVERANRLLEALQVELVSSVASLGTIGPRKIAARVSA